MMRPTLLLQPVHTSSAEILKCFNDGRPLTCDQLNYISRFQHALSSPSFDVVYKYYIEAAKRANSNKFILPSSMLNASALRQFKQRLQLFLSKDSQDISIELTPEQLLKFKEIAAPELIYYHGNQFLTGAPFFPGGIPPVLYFQWGNLFGVTKYLLQAGEKSAITNIFIHFELTHERTLEQCVKAYQLKLSNEIELQQHLFHENKIQHKEADHFVIKTPALTRPTPFHY